MVYQSPYSVNTHDPKHGFEAISDNKFGYVTADSDPTNHNRKVLRVDYKAGSYGTGTGKGAQFYIKPHNISGGREELTLSYDLYIDPNFEWIKGGKLPGLFGGATTCSGHRDTDNCFSTRYMWRCHANGEIYAYIPHNQYPSYADWCDYDHERGCNYHYDFVNNDIICNSHSGQSLGRGKFQYHHGRWHTFTQYVKLNHHQNHDGELKVWVDGHPVYHETRLLFRNDSSIKIDGIFFSTFFGGNDHTWATKRDTYTLFRDFRLYDSEYTPAFG
ncbi:hypothetical protein KUTeg_000249 [Tegillarca granosa]|uniref:Polysaccharide lyase 14 domain-containing protein n=1 Tax=Tegillarca granosa TaxID=220873 RepID=A0ABQ9G1D0_TEGGR|nr:hypothetical protein KUTeg_000249 [Tegillarca granosa]